jgi:hypothetical protein
MSWVLFCDLGRLKNACHRQIDLLEGRCILWSFGRINHHALNASKQGHSSTVTCLGTV